MCWMLEKIIFLFFGKVYINKSLIDAYHIPILKLLNRKLSQTFFTEHYSKGYFILGSSTHSYDKYLRRHLFEILLKVKL